MQNQQTQPPNLQDALSTDFEEGANFYNQNPSLMNLMLENCLQRVSKPTLFQKERLCGQNFAKIASAARAIVIEELGNNNTKFEVNA